MGHFWDSLSQLTKKIGRVINPLQLTTLPMTNYRHFNDKERDDLQYYLHIEKLKQNKIAEILWKDPSSISREINRNKTMIHKRFNGLKDKKDAEKWMYNSWRAQKKYLDRRKESKQLCPLKTLALFEYVPMMLKKWYSPDIIAWRASLDWIWDISHECIYQFIYSRMWIKMELAQYLPRKHKRRRKKSWRKEKRTLIPNRVWIELRPVEVENREEFGHWEGDSIVGVWTWAALNTNRERKSRKMFIEKIDRKTAENTKLATIKRFKPLPKWARKTKTDDNWCEFTRHAEVTAELWMNIYFADPYASWQRWTNENWNWLVRRFFPKRTSFDNITHEEIKVVEDWINNRPMKCLWYKTPNEVFEEELLKLNALPMKEEIALDDW